MMETGRVEDFTILFIALQIVKKIENTLIEHLLFSNSSFKTICSS